MAELNLGHVVGPGVPTGGTSGQVLKKNSSTNFDTSWSANDATTIPMSSSDSTSINEAITNTNPGQSLASNTDLDTVLTPGKYYCASNSTGQTILHRPQKYSGATRSFSVDVVQVGGSARIMQIYYDYIDNMPLIRHLNSGVVTSDWQELVPKEVTNYKTIQDMVFNQLDANGTITVTGPSSYPSDPGVYRIVRSMTGLPSGASYYGALVIFNAGSYWLHIYASSNGDFYYTQRSGSGTPTTWRKVIGTAVDPVT